MACYLVADMRISDAELFREFVEAVPPTVEKYAGRYLIRGGKFEVAQGDWTPDRVVVIEFGSMDQAKAWYDSPEFEGPKQTLARSSNSNFIFVEGV